MRIVITGSTGFLGLALVELLNERNNEICVLVRPQSNLSKLRPYKNIKLIEYASLKEDFVRNTLQAWKPEVMVHLAWRGVQGIDRNAAYHFTENITFTLEAVELAGISGCKQWIGVGSQAEYGIVDRKIDEKTLCNPASVYGKAKLATGIAALGLCELLGLKGCWGRVFSVYGPGDHPGTFISYLINCFSKGITPVLTRCEQQWDYLYITDAAAAIAALIEYQCSGLFNIGSGNTVRLKEVVEILKQETAFRQNVVYGEKEYNDQQIMHLEADIEKLKRHTGWQPLVPLNSGLARTIQSLEFVTNESV